MEKGLTVGELKELLNKYPDDLVVTVLRDGKGHHYPITGEHVKVLDNCYFPYDVEQDKEGFKFLQIGAH